MTNRIAYRYAHALLQSAEQPNTLERIGADMRLIKETLDEIPKLRATLASPVIRPHVLDTILQQIFGAHISKESLNFIALLIRKKRGNLLGVIAAEFQALLDSKNNLVNAEIKSATALDEDSRKKIVAKLKTFANADIRATYKVDPALRGGFVAKVGDTLIDASLAHQLEILREQFKDSGMHRLN